MEQQRRYNRSASYEPTLGNNNSSTLLFKRTETGLINSGELQKAQSDSFKKVKGSRRESNSSNIAIDQDRDNRGQTSQKPNSKEHSVGVNTSQTHSVEKRVIDSPTFVQVAEIKISAQNNDNILAHGFKSNLTRSLVSPTGQGSQN